MANVSKTDYGRYQYLLSTMSQSRVSQETGIPRSTLYDFSKQSYGLSDAQSQSLRNAYGRTVYGELRELGMSRTQATRFEFQKLETVEYVKDAMKQLVPELSQGVYEMREHVAKQRGVEWDEPTERQNATETVLYGLRKSKKTKEEWEQYQVAGFYIEE